MVEARLGDAEKRVDDFHCVEERKLRNDALRDGDVVERGAEVHEHDVRARTDEWNDRAPTAAGRRGQRVKRAPCFDASVGRRSVDQFTSRAAVPPEDLVEDVPAFGGLGWVGAGARVVGHG